SRRLPRKHRRGRYNRRRSTDREWSRADGQKTACPGREHELDGTMEQSHQMVALALFFTAAAGLADVVVLKGGSVITLQHPPVRRGNNVILTRTDGTLLSVPASEIDRAATAARNAAPPPPAPASAIPARPATLAEAAR